MSEELARARLVLVLLHGRWYRSGSMEDLTARLDVAGTACVAPAAEGRTWYPERFMDPRTANEPALSRSIAQAHETLDRLEAEGVDPERIVFGGFSQGGCVACEALAQSPRKLAALVVLCGGLIGATEDEITKPPAGSLDAMPALITGTVDDEWIPTERVERTADIFEAAGARVTMRIHPPAPHEVHDAEVEELRRLLLEVRGG